MKWPPRVWTIQKISEASRRFKQNCWEHIIPGFWAAFKLGLIYSPLVAILEHPKWWCTSSCGPRWGRSVALPSITILKLTNTTPLEIPHCHVISLTLCLGPLLSSHAVTSVGFQETHCTWIHCATLIYTNHKKSATIIIDTKCKPIHEITFFVRILSSTSFCVQVLVTSCRFFCRSRVFPSCKINNESSY